MLDVLFICHPDCAGNPIIGICYREIDKEEFKKVMALMRAHNRQGAFHKNGLRTGFKVNDLVENGGLVKYFFGEDGSEPLHLDKFAQFLRDLQEEVSLLPSNNIIWEVLGFTSDIYNLL